MVEESLANIGAEIMGRGKFGDRPRPGATIRGWGGEEPFHAPVFVVTHHEREPLTLADTTLVFVTEGFESALDQAAQRRPGRTSSSAAVPA